MPASSGPQAAAPPDRRPPDACNPTSGQSLQGPETFMPDAIYDDWSGIARILMIAPAAYLSLVIILRVSGKRTLSKLNAFDFIVTIAIGSTLASIITTRSLALAEGLAALAVLVGLQYLVTATSVRWPMVNAIVKAEPSLLLRNGEPLQSAMRRQRVTLDELTAAVRQAGGSSLEAAQAVYLETDGSLTAIVPSR